MNCVLITRVMHAFQVTKFYVGSFLWKVLEFLGRQRESANPGRFCNMILQTTHNALLKDSATDKSDKGI